MQSTDINVQTAYSLAFPSDNKTGVTEFILYAENI